MQRQVVDKANGRAKAEAAKREKQKVGGASNSICVSGVVWVQKRKTSADEAETEKPAAKKV